MGSSASSAIPSAAGSLADVPAGRILFHRVGSDGVEHYFTINTDGTDEQALYDAEGCGCAHWSADGTHVLTLGATEHDTFSFTTYRADGSERVVVDNPIKTLNLAPGATTADGRWIAFNGWDDTDPSNTGLYLASPDLTNLRLVLPLPEGVLAVEPFGITPDGSQIVFFADTGPDGGTTHAGDNHVMDSDGGGLRQLNPPGTKTGYIGVPTVSLSPDGHRAAFGVDDAVWVVDLDGGEARQITDGTGFVWAVSWSPTGEWITYTRQHGATSVISLVRPDGTDDREISANDSTDEASAGAWSPGGDFLVVQRGVDDRKDLWIMDLEGNFVGQVTDLPSTYGTYSWAPVSGS
jgi:Tol biopolymer transport system component